MFPLIIAVLIFFTVRKNTGNGRLWAGIYLVGHIILSGQNFMVNASFSKAMIFSAFWALLCFAMAFGHIHYRAGKQTHLSGELPSKATVENGNSHQSDRREPRNNQSSQS